MIDSPRPDHCSKPSCYISQWLICISGFLQDEGRPTGMVGLFSVLHHRFFGPHSRVELRSWNDDWNVVAEFIWRQRPFGNHIDNHVDVCIFAYSWGGPSAMELARQLGRRGIPVRKMVLADPVYRHRWKFWRVFFRWPKISVPGNVLHVRWYRQRQDWPQGHDLVAEVPGQTDIELPTVLSCGHSYADDSPRFHGACLAAAQEGAND